MTYLDLENEVRNAVGDGSPEPFATSEEIFRYLSEGQDIVLARRPELSFVSGVPVSVTPEPDVTFPYPEKVALLLRLYASSQVLGKIGGRRSDPKQSANLLQQFFTTLGA